MRRAVFLACLTFLAAGCNRLFPFPDEDLSTLAGASQHRKGCATNQCLYIYVAPWCGVCRASTPMLLEFRKFLKHRNIEHYVIVGKDEFAACTEYAREWGPDTLLDPEGKVIVPGGVPHFIATDKEGTILKSQAGVPFVLQPPVPEPFFIKLATFFGMVDAESNDARQAENWIQTTAAGRYAPWPPN